MKKISSRLKIVLATACAVFSLFSTMFASYAWFMVRNPSVRIDTITGDMSISLKRVSVYRYVYPFYSGSNTLIDYQSPKAGVREYVLKDEEEGKEFSEPTLTEEENVLSNYYIVGDSTFLGTNDLEEYRTSSGIILSSDGIANGVVLSKGAHIAIRKGNEFVSFHEVHIPEGIVSCSDSSSFFEATEPGIYDFKVVSNGSLPSLTVTKVKRDDDAIVGMTLFDPTLAKFNNQDPATAIYSQNTCLIFDVSLLVKSDGHDFTLKLDAIRGERNLLNNTNLPLSDYVGFRIQNPDGSMDAKKIFHLFHPDKLDTEGQKNYNSDSSSFETNSTSMNVSEIPFASDSETSIQDETSIRLCIAVDYKPALMDGFFQSENLGRQFQLYRDFSFYFSSQQVIAKKGGEASK